MLSGIGPAPHLAEHGIPIQLDLPGVGQHLKDHPIVDTMWRIKTGSIEFTKPDTGIWNAIKTTTATLWWLLTGGGAMSSNVSAHI